MSTASQGQGGQSPHGGGHQGGHHVVATPSAIVISLTEDQQKQAQQCLSRNGHVKFSFKEVTATKLPEMLDNGVQVD
jgi:hypothetical protein